MAEGHDYSALIHEHNGNIQAAADSLGISYDALRFRKARQIRKAERGELGTRPVLPGFAIKSIASKTSDGTWVKQVRAPGEVYEIPQGLVLKGESALVDPDGRVLAKWVKSNEGAASAKMLADVMRASFNDFVSGYKRAIPPASAVGSLLTDYVVGDHHLSMLAWPKETLGPAYDLNIAENILNEKCEELVERTPFSETGIFSNLGDFFHSNSAKNETVKGTEVDVDGRYGKALQVGLRLAVSCIEKLLTKHDRVIINWLRGNHDSEVAMGASLSLWAWFRSEPRVEIDFNPSKFFVHQHGKTMLGATHGDTLKPSEAIEFFASQYPEMWGATTKRYIKFGHVHHKATGGTAGSLHWESFETLAPKDAYHASRRYQADRSMTAITYHDKTGEFSRNRVSVG